MTEERRNFKEYMQDFFTKHLNIIKKNAVDFKEESGFEDMDKKLLAVFVSKIAFSGFLMAAVVGAGMFLIYHALTIVLYFHSILSQHRALYILVMGLIVIGVLALIIESFKKKDNPMKTEREEDSERKNLAKDLLMAIRKLAPKYGLLKPDTVSDIYSFGTSPCEIRDNVYIYVFSVEKNDNSSSEVVFNENGFKFSMIRYLKKAERANELTVCSPYGFIQDDEELCSILIFGVTDEGNYIELRVARADEKSYALYKKECGNEGNNGIKAPRDTDF